MSILSHWTCNTPPPCPSPPDHENQPGGSQSEQPIYENVASSNGQLPPIADDSDIDSDYFEVENDAHIRIHSKKKERPHNDNELENSSKIYVQGHLPDYHSSIDARLRSVYQLNELVSSLSEQRIYQGLAMTDQNKEKIGIMPECVYMATNLLENLESMLLRRWRHWPQARRTLEVDWVVRLTPMCSNLRSGDNYSTEPVSDLNN